MRTHPDGLWSSCTPVRVAWLPSLREEQHLTLRLGRHDSSATTTVYGWSCEGCSKSRSHDQTGAFARLWTTVPPPARPWVSRRAHRRRVTQGRN
jgi:hypothetical protein